MFKVVTIRAEKIALSNFGVNVPRTLSKVSADRELFRTAISMMKFIATNRQVFYSAMSAFVAEAQHQFCLYFCASCVAVRLIFLTSLRLAHATVNRASATLALRQMEVSKGLLMLTIRACFCALVLMARLRLFLHFNNDAFLRTGNDEEIVSHFPILTFKTSITGWAGELYRGCAIALARTIFAAAFLDLRRVYQKGMLATLTSTFNFGRFDFRHFVHDSLTGSWMIC